MGAAKWAPRRPPAGTRAPDTVVFVDGVRRLEARAWIDTAETTRCPGSSRPTPRGIRCSGAATLEDVQVGRGLFAPAPGLGDVVTRHGTFEACKTKDAAGIHQLRGARTDDRMRGPDRRSRGPVRHELIVLDGPLRKGQHIRYVIGFVKTHHVRYLPSTSTRWSARSRPANGRRSSGSSPAVQPHTWYSASPGRPVARGPAWSVRGERPLPRPVVELADTVTVALPRFASVPRRPPRPPEPGTDRGARAAAPPPARRRGRVLSRAPCRARHAAVRPLDRPGRLRGR